MKRAARREWALSCFSLARLMITATQTSAADANEQPAPAPSDPPQYLNWLEAKEAVEKDHFPFQCHLKTNKDQLRLLQKMADDIPLACAIAAARGIGHTDEKSFSRLHAARNRKMPTKDLQSTNSFSRRSTRCKRTSR
jgi:hypothetical protein